MERSQYESENFENQCEIIDTSLNIIIYHIPDTSILEDKLRKLMKKYDITSVIANERPYFIESFLKALTEIFTDDSNGEILEVWHKMISEFILCIKKNLSFLQLKQSNFC